MNIDHNRVMAFFGISGYGPDWKHQPGRLGWGVGTDGYSQLFDVFFAPLMQHCGCRDLILHKPFPDNGGNEISLAGPVTLICDMEPLWADYTNLVQRLQDRGMDRVIEYHGAATQAPKLAGDSALLAIGALLKLILGVSLSSRGVGRIFDMASALKYDDPMALVILTLGAADTMRTPVYIEQRRSLKQPWFAGVKTFTMYSELLRQQARGGEPSLADFDPSVENVIALDVPPPDRDPKESWDPWIADQVQALQSEPHNFTVAVPIHSMVRRRRWDLLREIFGAAP